VIAHLPASGYREQRWKNGGGLVREIAVAFSGEPNAHMLWRVSIAEIDRDGPFSDYRGYDRTIVAIDGDPVELHLDGERVTLPLYEPIEFSGESRIDCRLHGGSARDLNVMTLRNAYTHDLEIVTSPQRFVLDNDETAFVFAIEGAASIDDTTCERGDTLRVDGGRTISVATHGRLAAIRLTPF
jgi:uncharacterized protein